MMPTILRVAILAPVKQTFDYLVPENIDASSLKPGIRLSVPFGKLTKIAILVEVAETTEIDHSALKRAHKILDHLPLLSQNDLKLLRWASQYYHHPIGEVIGTAFPTLLRKGKSTSIQSDRCFYLTNCGKNVKKDSLKHAHRQAALLDLIGSQQEGIGMNELSDLTWDWRTPLGKLLEKKFIKIKQPSNVYDISNSNVRSSFPLNPAQSNAIEKVASYFDKFQAFLLEGVTGSGKTEVYIQLIHLVLAQSKQVMVLIPEIALTPQLEARFRERFPIPIAILHSQLQESRRRDAWLRIQRGEVSLLLGTRSAVFTPLKNPGLIILDEEHDTSFKQQEGFRFSARDIAIIRAKQLKIPIILGSATPSLESTLNVVRGRFIHLHLPERAGVASEPVMRVLDIRNRRLQEGLSTTMIRSIQQTIARDEQVLLFLNRRGFAPALICHACGWVARCRHCDSNLVVHANEKCLRCHHCGHEVTLLACCPACKASELSPLGIGTERIEKRLNALFPYAKIARIDRDSIKNKGCLESLLTKIQAGKINILVGTQMLGKGHHFPRVTLVGILDVDAGLFSTDFRATERMAQLLIQVAGRAGREEKPGTVLLQTRHPEHALLLALINKDYRSFAADALVERNAARLPPYSYQALIRAKAKDKKSPQVFLTHASKLAKKFESLSTEVLGPVSAPIERLAGQYRYQLLLQSAKREDLHALIDKILPEFSALPEARRVRWALDVDPIDLF